MAYEGFVDFANETSIWGWVFDNSSPDAPVTVEILADGVVIAKNMANAFREDLLQHGKGNGKHGFSLGMQNAGAKSPLQARIEGKRWLLPSSQPSSLPVRNSHNFWHSLEYGFPAVNHRLSIPKASSDEPAILKRLIAAYHRAIQNDPANQQAKGDMWSYLKESCHGELIHLLLEENINGLGTYLRDAHNRGITQGVTQGAMVTEALRTNPATALFVRSQFVDYLVSLAEYLGILDVESPEQYGEWAENLHCDPELLLAEIEAKLGISVVAPDVVGSLFGLATSRGILSGRDLLALYGVLRLRDIVQQSGLDNEGVCEIGGGLGGAAYYSTLLGTHTHTIIDLPLLNVLQGYYLMRALPGKTVTLYGEPSTECPSVRILPTWEFERSENRYSMLFNMDSMPEIHIDYSLGYLRRAKLNVSHYFLSINQEARAPQSPNTNTKHTVVRDLVSTAGGYERLYRFRHWLRPGYVEELYRIRSGT